MLKLVLLIFIILIILCENDRNYLIKHKLYSYYIEFFPRQIYFGIHNTIYRLLNKKYVYPIESLNIEKDLQKLKKEIIQSYFKHYEILEEKAHNTSTMLSKDDNYLYIRLLFCGEENKNLDYFPNLKNFLKSKKEIRTCFLSIMKKEKVIPYHRGPYNGMLRYHFPVIMDKNSICYLEVMGEKITYDKSFLFDDTYPHSLIKKDDTLRVVLILDIDNPFTLYPFHKFFMK